MSKKKSMFVTAIISVMMAVIMFAAYRLSMPVFIVLVGILSGAGFMSVATIFCGWLQKPSERDEELIEPPLVVGDLENEDFSATYEQIKKEVESCM